MQLVLALVALLTLPQVEGFGFVGFLSSVTSDTSKCSPALTLAPNVKQTMTTMQIFQLSALGSCSLAASDVCAGLTVCTQTFPSATAFPLQQLITPSTTTSTQTLIFSIEAWQENGCGTATTFTSTCTTNPPPDSCQFKSGQNLLICRISNRLIVCF
eukprot:c12150_g1_i1.p1 GENE.c12150_g1_i1~~c12150_g1_i1.p1  ORF type:complete len:157 (-),score=33.71 c12150_g1_i1:316-786(-)